MAIRYEDVEQRCSFSFDIFDQFVKFHFILLHFITFSSNQVLSLAQGFRPLEVIVSWPVGRAHVAGLIGAWPRRSGSRVSSPCLSYPAR